MTKNYILITGATSGIGLACAEKFAAQGNNLILTGRRNDRLLALKEKLEKEFQIQVEISCFDIQSKDAVYASMDKLAHLKNQVSVLINNAGLAAGRDNFQDASLDDWEQMIDTNIKGVMYITQIVSKWMIENKKGHIINIGSTAGKEVYPQGNMYCATKHAVDALTKAMRQDLLPHNIKVTGIHPGAAETEFSLVRFKGDQSKADAVYKGFEPLHPEDIADIIYYTTTLPANVCINELIVTPTAQANSYLINKLN
ncbi:MAG: SDR family NAD(P)-dependent oxidoreductase [Bacteroidetes bacterium]|nr:SDR family NAD(P)-dependent oxidoreductase [Bacteroidota bacterium]